jgi:endonuclease YncB( thermonuclease family)
VQVRILLGAPIAHVAQWRELPVTNRTVAGSTPAVCSSSRVGEFTLRRMLALDSTGRTIRRFRQSARAMAGWAYRRGMRRARGINAPLLVALVLAAGLLIYHAVYRYRATEPLAPVTGYARVVDGDSIEVAGVRIRLDGIDAPELDQPCTDADGRTWSCGKTAADELRRFIKGRDGSDVNAWSVRQGWALASGRAGNYRSEQNEAQAARRGIWAGSFTPPREWRQHHAQ